MKVTNLLNLPQAFVDNVDPNRHEADADATITQLIDSPRVFWLRKRHWNDITVDVSDMVWSIFGTAMHAVLAGGKDENNLKEEKMKMDVLGWKIKAQPDLFDGNTLTDWKTCKVWSIVFKSSEKSWERQLNCYAYFFRKNGFDPKKLEVVALLKDWSMAEACLQKKYTMFAVERVVLPMWPENEQENYLYDRVRLMRSFRDVPDDDLPECLAEEKWQTAGIWQAKKTGRKSAVKNCENEEHAKQVVAQGYKGADTVFFRPGKCNRCLPYEIQGTRRFYCNVTPWCKYYKEPEKEETETEKETA